MRPQVLTKDLRQGIKQPDKVVKRVMLSTSDTLGSCVYRYGQ